MAIAATEAIPIAESLAGASTAGAAEGAAGVRAGAADARASASKPTQPKRSTGSSGAKKGKAAVLPGGKGRAGSHMKWASNKKILLAEFVICVVILGMGAITSSEKTSEVLPRTMIKGTALSLLFFLLAIGSAGGQGSTKVATALGTLVTATYVFTSKDVHVTLQWITKFFGDSPGDAGAAWQDNEASVVQPDQKSNLVDTGNLS